MIELAVLENAHLPISQLVILTNPHVATIHHFSRREQSSRNSAGSARSAPLLLTRLCGATAARLRFEKGHDIPELVSDRGSVDSPERAADVQSSFILQHLHAAPADSGVDVLINPRPRHRRH